MITQSRRAIHRSVILAAGRGTRLGDLTADRPKPMIPVRGIPVLEHIVVGLRDRGIDEFLLVVGYKAEAIRDHFGDGAGWGVRIECAEQNPPNGTGAALALAEGFAGGEPIIMSYGDILTDYAHYLSLASEFEPSPCAAVLGINPVDDPSAGAAVYLNGSRVTRVVEKPPPGTANTPWNLAGVYAFAPSIFPALAEIPYSPRGEKELTSAISFLLESGAEVRACKLLEFWSDIGTPEALADAERLW